MRARARLRVLMASLLFSASEQKAHCVCDLAARHAATDAELGYFLRRRAHSSLSLLNLSLYLMET